MKFGDDISLFTFSLFNYMKKLLIALSMTAVVAVSSLSVFAATQDEYASKITDTTLRTKLDSAVMIFSKNAKLQTKMMALLDKYLMNPSYRSNANALGILGYLKAGLQNASSPYKNMDIVDTAVAAKSFPTLIAAVQAAGLVDALKAEWPFTVFAPTEEAFAALLKSLNLTAEQLLANKALLTKVLLYHVVKGDVRAVDVLASVHGSKVPTLHTKQLTINNFMNPMINDSALVTTDLVTKNGIIHVINKVLVPTDVLVELWLAQDMMAKDIVDTAVESKSFPTLIAAVQAAGLVDALKAEWPFTVFAPTEEAFAALLKSLNLTAEQLLADKVLLTKVLLYHVVPGTYTAKDVMSIKEPTSLKTLQGTMIKIMPKDGAYYVNGSKITSTDIMAKNGVIHVIDAVLVP